MPVVVTHLPSWTETCYVYTETIPSTCSLQMVIVGQRTLCKRMICTVDKVARKDMDHVI